MHHYTVLSEPFHPVGHWKPFLQPFTSPLARSIENIQIYASRSKPCGACTMFHVCELSAPITRSMSQHIQEDGDLRPLPLRAQCPFRAHNFGLIFDQPTEPPGPKRPPPQIASRSARQSAVFVVGVAVGHSICLSHVGGHILNWRRIMS